MRRVPTKTSVVRCAVNLRGDAIVDLGPHLIARDRGQLVAGNFDGERHFAAVPDVDDRRALAQEMRDVARSGAPSPRGRCAAAFAPLVCATRSSRRASVSARCEPRLSRRHRVDLVDDDRFDAGRKARATSRPSAGCRATRAS